MAWPPQVGKPLPGAANAIGVRQKLMSYSLNAAHERGGPKARGFERILGIAIDHIDHLEAEIQAGILVAPIKATRRAIPTGFNCVVEVPVRGLGLKRERLIAVRTAWLIPKPGGAPHMTTAFPKP